MFYERVQDHTINQGIKRIIPAAPCEACGLELEDTRRTKLAKCSDPIPHWREYCYVCRQVSVAGENTFMPTAELNSILWTVAGQKARGLKRKG